MSIVAAVLLRRWNMHHPAAETRADGLVGLRSTRNG